MDEPGDGWHHIEAAGEHPAVIDDGETLVQVLDDEAMEALVNHFDGELLVDRDHLSRDREHDTAAAAWLKGLAAFRDETGRLQLAGWLEWTPSGRALIEGKEYKHFSTEYEPETMENLGGGRWRPRRLAGLALTNRPNNRGQRPITNRESGEATRSESETNQQQQQPKASNMEELNKIALQLGLEEGAGVEDILAAISGLQEASDAAREAEAEAILNSEGGQDMSPEEKEMMKEELITNRARALRVLKNRAAARGGAVKTPPAAAVYARPIMNRAGMNSRADKTRKALSIRDRAHEIQQRTGLGYFEALSQAQRELGEA